MSGSPPRYQRVFAELKRRHVFRVVAVYGVVGFVVLQVIDLVIPALLLPAWTYRLVALLLLAGFPVAIVLTWAFEQTPDGWARIEAADAEELDVIIAQPASRRWPAGVLALLGAVLLLGGWWIGRESALGREGAQNAESVATFGGDTSAVELPATLIAVLPFDYRGSDELSYLSEGIVDLFSAKLNGAAELRTVHPRAVLSAAGLDDGLNMEESSQLARRLGAGSFITGSVIEAAGRLEIRAVLRSGSDATEVSTRTTEQDVLEALDGLVRQLIRSRFHEASRQVERLATVTTSSVPALKAFLKGQAAFRRGEAETAAAHFQKAISEDSTFALAHYRWSQSASWFPRMRADFVEVRGSLSVAHRHAHRLPKPLEQLVPSLIYSQRRSYDSAEAVLRPLIRTHPNDPEAWYRLGEVLIHGASSRGRERTEAGYAFKRTVELDPQQALALLHLADIAAEEGDSAALDSIHARLEATVPERAVIVAAYRLMLRTDPAALDSLTSLAAALEPEILTEIFWRSGAVIRNRTGMHALLDAVLDEAPGAEVAYQYSAFAKAGLAAAEGRPSAMIRLLDESGGFEGDDIPSMLPEPTFLLVLPFLPIEPEVLHAARSALHRRDSQTSLYYQGLLSLRIGDRQEAEAILEQLAAMGTPYFAPALAAHVAWSDGDAETTLAQLARTRPSSLLPAEKYLRAEALAATGREQEAVEWFGALPELSPTAAFEIALYPPAELRRGQLLEELGDQEGAKIHYGRFLNWWSDAEPELQPTVRGAREALQRLSAQ